jgi:septal ring factor EnvC (AmiA/AmiB activator)
LTLLSVLAAYALFDKFILDPRALSESLKIQKEDYDERFADQKLIHDTRLGVLQDRVMTEDAQKISTLNVTIGKLERDLSRTKRELDAVRSELADQRNVAKNATSALKNSTARHDKQRAETARARLKVEDLKRAGDTLFVRYKGMLDQRTVLFDNVCKQLVDLRKKAPKGTPKAYKERINRLIRRIRDAEKIDLSGKKQ